MGEGLGISESNLSQESDESAVRIDILGQDLVPQSYREDASKTVTESPYFDFKSQKSVYNKQVKEQQAKVLTTDLRFTTNVYTLFGDYESGKSPGKRQFAKSARLSTLSPADRKERINYLKFRLRAMVSAINFI